MPVLGAGNPTPYTVGYLLNRTLDLLLGAAQEDLNNSQNVIQVGDTSIVLQYPSGRAQPGSYIAIDDEVIYVWTATDNSSGGCTLTVQRGMKGTTAVQHEPNVVYVNPYFPRYQVRKTLMDEIRSWGPQIFNPASKVVSGVDFVRGYDLGLLGKCFRVLEVRRSPDTLWATPDPEDWPRVKFQVVNQAPTSDFASGQAIIITDPIEVFDAPKFNIVYAAPIDVDSSFDDGDSVIAMGMDASDIDIAPYGAAWRLASGREVRRMLVQAQANTADLQNFPPGYMIKTAEEFKQLRDSRLQDAIERLLQQYPVTRM